MYPIAAAAVGVICSFGSKISTCRRDSSSGGLRLAIEPKCPTQNYIKQIESGKGAFDGSMTQRRGKVARRGR